MKIKSVHTETHINTSSLWQHTALHDLVMQHYHKIQYDNTLPPIKLYHISIRLTNFENVKCYDNYLISMQINAETRYQFDNLHLFLQTQSPHGAQIFTETSVMISNKTQLVKLVIKCVIIS